jgi:hypothetical protein
MKNCDEMAIKDLNYFMEILSVIKWSAGKVKYVS